MNKHKKEELALMRKLVPGNIIGSLPDFKALSLYVQGRRQSKAKPSIIYIVLISACLRHIILHKSLYCYIEKLILKTYKGTILYITGKSLECHHHASYGRRDHGAAGFFT